MDPDASGPLQSTQNEQAVQEMLEKSTIEINAIVSGKADWKKHALPVARVKKIMKTEEFVLQELEKDRQKAQNVDPRVDGVKPLPKFMVSSECPVLMSKACELLIKELTTRAWHHTERNRRKTLQKPDVHAAAGESDMFDFLIDIVPRVANPNLRYDVGVPPAPVNFDHHHGQMPPPHPDFGNHGNDGAQPFFNPPPYGAPNHMPPDHHGDDVGHPETPGGEPGSFV